MRRSLLTAAGLALFASPAAFAGAAGGDPLNFLFLDANARAVAMGGAYTALATDANALLYNPAGLGAVERHEATFMHNEYFQGASQEYIGYASPRGVGANVNSLRSGDVARTTISNPDGTGLGGANLSDLSLALGYGRPLGDSLRLGAGMKYIRETIAGISASGYAADLGALYSVPAARGLALGLSVQNLGPSIKFQSAKENLETLGRML